VRGAADAPLAAPVGRRAPGVGMPAGRSTAAGAPSSDADPSDRRPVHPPASAELSHAVLRPFRAPPCRRRPSRRRAPRRRRGRRARRGRALPAAARAQWVTTYEQFYLQAPHNWVFRSDYQAADRLFNAFDYGHAILYEKLWTRPTRRRRSSRSGGTTS
jgi:hypothetical protein